MTRIIIFFQDEIIISIKSQLDDELQYWLQLDFLTHFVIVIVRNIVQMHIWFEIMTHRSSFVFSFLIFLFNFVDLLNAILKISLIKFANYTYFILWFIFKVHLIAKFDSKSIIVIRISFFYDCDSFNSTFNCEFVDSYFFVNNTLMITHRIHYIFDCIICTVQFNFVIKLFSNQFSCLHFFFFQNFFHFTNFRWWDDWFSISCLHMIRMIMNASRWIITKNFIIHLARHIECSKNILFVIRNFHFFAKFNSFLYFNFIWDRIMLHSIKKWRSESKHNWWKWLLLQFWWSKILMSFFFSFACLCHTNLYLVMYRERYYIYSSTNRKARFSSEKDLIWRVYRCMKNSLTYSLT
jgi:hypothetical protein